MRIWITSTQYLSWSSLKYTCLVDLYNIEILKKIRSGTKYVDIMYVAIVVSIFMESLMNLSEISDIQFQVTKLPSEGNN